MVRKQSGEMPGLLHVTETGSQSEGLKVIPGRKGGTGPEKVGPVWGAIAGGCGHESNVRRGRCSRWGCVGHPGLGKPRGGGWSSIRIMAHNLQGCDKVRSVFSKRTLCEGRVRSWQGE